MIKVIKEYIKNHRSLRSLKLQLFILFVLTAIIVSFSVRGSFIKSYKEQAIADKQDSVTRQLKVLARHLISNDYKNPESKSRMEDEIQELSELTLGRILIIDDNRSIVSDSKGRNAESYKVPEWVYQCFGGGDYYEISKNNLTIAVPLEEYSYEDGSKNVAGVLIIEVPTTDIKNSASKMGGKVLVFQLILIIIVGAVGYVIANILVLPLTRLTETIESVASFEEGDITASTYQETEGIVTAFNAQRSRLKVLDDSRQEFVSNVSHELRTPITSMKVLADSLLLMEDAPIEMYRDFMQDITEEIDRENSIITDLLALVNMDKGKEGLNIQTVDCCEMIELIIKRLTPIANQNDVEIIFDYEQPIYADIDDVKMTLALTNLVENGIKYNHPGGYVQIFVDIDHQFIVFTIEDSGMGIPEDAIGHIYERFYRVDKSHSREIGGTGLGLPISRKIILLHRGSITVDSQVSEGTVFTVRIPAVVN